MEKYIAFPGLGLEFHINPIAITIFSHPIYWYGIILTSALLLSALYAMKRCKTFGFENEDDIIDVVLIAAPLGFIMARIYYVVFSFENYKDNLIDIFKIWEGGIAIYGGVIGGALGLFIYAKWKKINFLKLLDLGACSILLGQAIGRWGNFVNVEAYGGETTSIFRMVIREGADMSVGVQPTFLYESVWNIIGFAILYFVSKKAYKFVGQMALLYVSWYGLGRAVIEGMRSDSLYFGTFRVSQVLGVITSVVGILAFIYFWRKQEGNALLEAIDEAELGEEMVDASEEMVDASEEVEEDKAPDIDQEEPEEPKDN